jgi:hypothetical protein
VWILIHTHSNISATDKGKNLALSVPTCLPDSFLGRVAMPNPFILSEATEEEEEEEEESTEEEDNTQEPLFLNNEAETGKRKLFRLISIDPSIIATDDRWMPLR